MGGGQKTNDNLYSVVLGLIILGVALFYLKKSGRLDEIVNNFNTLSGHTAKD